MNRSILFLRVVLSQKAAEYTIIIALCLMYVQIKVMDHFISPVYWKKG